MTIKFLLRKEFTQILRNSFLPRLIMMFPISTMCIMPWVMNMEIKHIVVDVVDNDRSIQSQQLVNEIAANTYFVLHGQQPTYAAALKNIEKSDVDVVVVIPQHYSKWYKRLDRFGVFISDCYCQCVAHSSIYQVESFNIIPL